MSQTGSGPSISPASVAVHSPSPSAFQEHPVTAAQAVSVMLLSHSGSAASPASGASVPSASDAVNSPSPSAFHTHPVTAVQVVSEMLPSHSAVPSAASGASP